MIITILLKALKFKGYLCTNKIAQVVTHNLHFNSLSSFISIHFGTEIGMLYQFFLTLTVLLFFHYIRDSNSCHSTHKTHVPPVALQWMLDMASSKISFFKQCFVIRGIIKEVIL